MLEGPSVDRHHLVPKSLGGAETITLHRVCHTKIHSVLTEAELAAGYATLESLRAHDAIVKFVTWVRKQPPEYVGRHRRPRR